MYSFIIYHRCQLQLGLYFSILSQYVIYIQLWSSHFIILQKLRGLRQHYEYWALRAYSIKVSNERIISLILPYLLLKSSAVFDCSSIRK